MYFEKPRYSLPKLQREGIIAVIPRKSLMENLKEFLGKFEDISHKLSFQDYLRSRWITSIISEDYAVYWYNLYIFITLVLNALMLAAWKAGLQTDVLAPVLYPWSPNILLSFAIMHMVVSFVLVLTHYVNHANDKWSIAKIAHAIYHGALFALSVAGPFTYYYFYGIFLLHIVQGSPVSVIGQTFSSSASPGYLALLRHNVRLCDTSYFYYFELEMLLLLLGTCKSQMVSELQPFLSNHAECRCNGERYSKTAHRLHV